MKKNRSKIRRGLGCFGFAALFILSLFLSQVNADSYVVMQTYSAAVIILAILVVLLNSTSNTATILSCHTMIMLAPVWFLAMEALFAGGDAWLLPANDVILALGLACLFLSAFNFFYIIRPSNRIIQWHDKVLLRTVKPNLASITGILITGLLVIVIFSRYQWDWETVKQVYLGGRKYGSGGLIKRGGVGGWEVFLQPLAFVAPLVPTVAALSWVRFAQGKPAFLFLRVSVSLCAVFLIFVMFLGGSRGNMAVYLAGPGAVWIIFGRRLGRIAFTTTTFCFFILLIGVWEFQKRKRSHLLEGISSIDDFTSQTTFDPTKSHRDNNLYFLTLVRRFHPDPWPYKGWDELIYFATLPIPRVLWANKPKGIHENAESFKTPTGPASMGPKKMGTASLSMSIIGDGYAMQGHLGVIFYAAIMGLLASFWDRLAQSRILQSQLYFILNSAWLFWFLWGFRAAFAFVTGMYAVWGAVLFCYLAGRMGNRIRPKTLSSSQY